MSDQPKPRSKKLIPRPGVLPPVVGANPQAIHVFKAGETFTGIARQHGTTWYELCAHNAEVLKDFDPEADPFGKTLVGKVLHLPPPPYKAEGDASSTIPLTLDHLRLFREALLHMDKSPRVEMLLDWIARTSYEMTHERYGQVMADLRCRMWKEKQNYDL